MKRDSRHGGEISDWFTNFQPFKSTVRERSHIKQALFNQVLLHGNPA